MQKYCEHYKSYMHIYMNKQINKIVSKTIKLVHPNTHIFEEPTKESKWYD